MNLDALPLFPLQSMVFPGLPIQLQVFEDRYKALVADTLAGSRHFGIVAIAAGPEVGGEAQPYMIGVLMSVTSADQQENGQIALVATAVERIKLTNIDRGSKPYLIGAAQLWPDEPEPIATSAEIAETQAAFNQYVAAILRDIGSSEHEIAQRTPLKLPDDPLLLSILVSSMMQVPLAEKQELLAASSSGQRVLLALRLLNRELTLLRLAHAGPAVRPIGASGMFSNN